MGACQQPGRQPRLGSSGWELGGWVELNGLLLESLATNGEGWLLGRVTGRHPGQQMVRGTPVVVGRQGMVSLCEEPRQGVPVTAFTVPTD